MTNLKDLLVIFVAFLSSLQQADCFDLLCTPEDEESAACIYGIPIGVLAVSVALLLVMLTMMFHKPKKSSVGNPKAPEDTPPMPLVKEEQNSVSNEEVNAPPISEEKPKKDETISVADEASATYPRSCSLCGGSFKTPGMYRAHKKTKWHQSNMRRSTKGKKAL